MNGWRFWLVAIGQMVWIVFVFVMFAYLAGKEILEALK